LLERRSPACWRAPSSRSRARNGRRTEIRRPSGLRLRRQQQDEAAAARRQRRIVPLESVLGQIRAREPGRQLDAGLEYRGDRVIYRVRWMTADGRRVDYMIDATTGAILSGH